MFQHNTVAFGRFERHIFSNTQTNTSFSIVPEYGGVLIDAIFDGVNVIEGFATPEELEHQKWGKSIVLYPFPNRMHDGTFHHNGEKYQFPIDNPATNNAIHGFGKKMPHPITAMILAEHYACITCTNEYDGHLNHYPFPCTFEIIFTCYADKMEVEMIFKNTGDETIPAGIGWHPYFSISDKIEDTAMQTGEIQWVAIDDRMLPTGEKIPYTVFEKMTLIGDTSLDNGFFIPKQGENFEVSLQSSKGKLQYWQETGENLYNFIQIFTPPHRTCIALEPMTCNVNAFNNKDGLILLTAGKSIAGKFGFSFEKNV
jgi:aldose 1-epimerase